MWPEPAVIHQSTYSGTGPAQHLTVQPSQFRWDSPDSAAYVPIPDLPPVGVQNVLLF